MHKLVIALLAAGIVSGAAFAQSSPLKSASWPNSPARRHHSDRTSTMR